MSSRIICVGDLHADVATAGFPRLADVTAAVDETVALALRTPCAALWVFLGDLCDPDAPGAWAAGELACSTANRLARGGVPSLWLTGNHDVLENGSGTSTLEPLIGMSHETGGLSVAAGPEYYQHEAFDVVALPYAPRSHAYDPEAFVRDLPYWVGKRRTLVFGHLDLDGAVPGSEALEYPRGRETFWPIDALRARLPEAILVGGHLHKRGVVRGVHLAGSLERLSFGDGIERQPGFLEITVEG